MCGFSYWGWGRKAEDDPPIWLNESASGESRRLIFSEQMWRCRLVDDDQRMVFGAREPPC